ncbi:MAG: MFS transporter [Bryobacterales bacterium]|nr:MFS transporter [Bryobacterales bacterium]
MRAVYQFPLKPFFLFPAQNACKLEQASMPHRYRVLIFLFFLVFIMYLDRLCIAVAGPRMQQDLALGPREWGWVMGAFTLAYALFEVPSGMLGDRIGPRRVLTRIVLWWSAFTVATGLVSSLKSLLIVRFLFGAGEAGAFPNCTATVSRWIPAVERARSTSVFWMATSVGGAATPLLVVPIQQAYGWRAAFYIFGSLGVFWAAAWHWWFRDTPAEMKGITAAERQLIGHQPASHHRGLPWRVVLHNRNFQRVLVMYHLYCWGAYFYLSWLPTYLQTGRGMTEDQMKIASAMPPLAGLFGVLAGGFLSDRLSRKYSLRMARCSIGAASLIGAGACLIAATLVRGNTTAVVLMSVGLGIMNAMLPVAWSLCVDLGKQHSGAISGAMNMAGQAGSFISSVAFGYFVEWFGSYDLALMPLAAMLILSGITFAAIDPSDRLIPEAQVAGLASP